MILPFMIQGNWLCRYDKIEGIRKTLSGLDKRISHPTNMALAADLLLDGGNQFRNNFEAFFPELERFVKEL